MFNTSKLIEIRNNILKYLQPKMEANAIDEIDFSKLLNLGLTNIILDLDETLIPRNLHDVLPSVYTFISELKQAGFNICLTSNSRHPIRVDYIARTLEIPHIAMALKPFPSAFKKAMRIMGSNRKNTIVIGDQIFTDVLGGNLLNLYTIFVHPITPETFFVRKYMRKLEKNILKLEL